MNKIGEAVLYHSSEMIQNYFRTNSEAICLNLTICYLILIQNQLFIQF